jgi:hypothetical protein
MAEVYYIRVPLDDLEQPHWRCLQAEDGGDGAVVLALRLRGLAAKCNHGGLIVRHTGEPMPLLQLATYLGYTPQQFEHRLLLLAKYGLAEATEDQEGGIRVVDPVLGAHLGRVNGAVQLVLPAQKNKRNQKYSRVLTQAERTHLCRTGQLPEGVYRIDVSRPMSHPDVTPAVTLDVTLAVTPVLQTADNIVDTYDVTSSKSISISDSSKSSSKSVTPAAAISPAPQNQNPTPPPEVMAAIDRLPLEARLDCLLVVQDHLHLPPEVLISNIQLLADRLASPSSKPIDNPAGWLKKALAGDYGATERQAQAEAQTAKIQAAQRRQAQQEQKERERRAELQRQAQLLRQLEELDPDARAEVERDAAERMRVVGDGEAARLACLTAACADYIKTKGD